jgi:ABC-type proline/glycine betaine transport system ATPase subunit
MFVQTVLLLSNLVMPIGQEKRPSVADFPFWSAPKQEYVRQFIPGLDAALLLTADQVEKLAAVRRETIAAPALVESARKLKGDANATEEQRQAVRDTVAAAQEQLRTRAGGILTADQKALIAKVNAAWTDVQTNVRQEFESRFIAAKGNPDEQATVQREYREKVNEEFRRTVENLLNAEQRAAMTQAAERERSAASKPKK